MSGSPNPKLIADLVDANHILFSQGVVDGFGHVSVRHDKTPGHFLLSRSMAPGLVHAADIMEFDTNSEPVGGDKRPPYLERYIHGEIYRARPDVNAVVHSHSPSVIPFGVVASQKLRAICHMSGFLGSGAPVFEIRDFGGNGSNLLVTDHKLGEALAGTLGANAAVLMRGHGSTVAGQSLRQAVFRAIYTEMNARLQATAMALGQVNFLTDAEAVATNEMHSADPIIGRAWQLWKLQADAAALHPGA